MLNVLQSKSMNWYDRDLRHERIKLGKINAQRFRFDEQLGNTYFIYKMIISKGLPFTCYKNRRSVK